MLCTLRTRMTFSEGCILLPLWVIIFLGYICQGQEIGKEDNGPGINEANDLDQNRGVSFIQ